MSIFFNIYKHDFNTIKEILDECKSKSDKLFIDILSEDSVHRVSYDISYEECMEIFKKHKTHWVYILRHDRDELYWEVGGSTLARPKGDVFLFIYMDYQTGEKIKDKYELKQHV